MFGMGAARNDVACFQTPNPVQFNLDVNSPLYPLRQSSLNGLFFSECLKYAHVLNG